MYINIIYLLMVIVMVTFTYSLFTQKELFSFAWKNLYRNKRRTTLTMIAIILAGVASIFVETFKNNLFWGLRESTIRSELSHIQIQKKGYLEKGSAEPTKYLIDDPKTIVSAIRNHPELVELIEEVTTEITFNGLISGSGENSVTYIARGVEADKDLLFSSFDTYDSGVGLSSEDPSGIVLGSGLATLLGVETGGEVTMLAQNAFGSIDVLDGMVAGIFNPMSKDYGKVILKTDLTYAQELMGTSGVNKILILLKETKNTDFVAEKVQEIIGSQNDLTVYSWVELADFYTAVFNLFNNFFNVFTIIVSVIVFFMIMNTMTMSIFERFQEIGTLRSIGFTRKKIIFLFLNEGLLMGLVGGVLGIVLGLGVTWFVDSLDIAMAPPPGQNKEYIMRLKLLGHYEVLYHAFFTLVVISWVSSISPALKAARLKIVDCLRHV